MDFFWSSFFSCQVLNEQMDARQPSEAIILSIGPHKHVNDCQTLWWIVNWIYVIKEYKLLDYDNIMLYVIFTHWGIKLKVYSLDVLERGGKDKAESFQVAADSQRNVRGTNQEKTRLICDTPREFSKN